MSKKLNDPQNWDEYWSKKKSKKIYDFIAFYYRNLLIRPSLDYHINKFFKNNSLILHAGCGGGQVDANIIKTMNIHALDISSNALKIYENNNPKVSKLFHSSIFDTGFEDNKYDGIYNLGVLEHFEMNDINMILNEFKRILKSNGKILLFWPHKYGISVMFLKLVVKIFKILFNKKLNLHPKEITYIYSKKQIKKILENNGFRLQYYYFGIRDLFTQVVIVAEIK